MFLLLVQDELVEQILEVVVAVEHTGLVQVVMGFLELL